jgi:hypothetical protein
MIITNKQHLPEPFVSAVSNQRSYQTGVYSVTSLLKGIRETMLERRHSNEIEQDVSDMIWLILGSAVHSIVEKAQETDNQIKEARLHERINGVTFTGQFDLYDAAKKKVVDYKTCSVWKIMFGEFDDWKQQTMLYAYLLREAGFEVNKGEIVAIIKDHNKTDAKTKSNYPAYPVVVISWEITVKDLDETFIWLVNKAEEIKVCEDLEDWQLPLCTLEERYNRPKFAVMKKGQKKSIRTVDTMEDAEYWQEQNEGSYIETRPGVDKKCLDYCAAAKFCPYWQMLQKEVQNG